MLIAWAIGSQCAFAEDAPVSCPLVLSSELMGPAAVKGDWALFLSAPAKLTGAFFMQSSPEQMEYLKPDSVLRQGKKRIETWMFDGNYPFGKWLACDYADGAVSMSRRLSADVSECSVVYDKGRANPADRVKIDCK